MSKAASFFEQKIFYKKVLFWLNRCRYMYCPAMMCNKKRWAFRRYNQLNTILYIYIFRGAERPKGLVGPLYESAQ